MPDTLECVTQYIDAFTTNDFTKVPFDADVTFQTPLMDQPLKGKEAVIQFLTDVGAQMSDVRVKRHVVQADLACAVVEFVARGKLIEASDHFRVSGNGIVEIRAFFDPRPLLS